MYKLHFPKSNQLTFSETIERTVVLEFFLFSQPNNHNHRQDILLVNFPIFLTCSFFFSFLRLTTPT
jgi:hypothetical protein